ncbi:hypothetical protein [Streptomyces sp. NPDC059761]|uniref:hypothetical protein n=1 Tax=Streptomyces sp. NPDC059761 TaxID=3346937 RepID=UPI00365F9F74
MSARTRVRLMTEAGLLHRSAEAPWAGTTVWTSERGVRHAATTLSAPRWPGERLLHRLAVADVGLALEAKGHTVLTEREIRSAEAIDGGAWEPLEDLGVAVEPRARRGETFAVPVGTRALHWPDLILVLPGGTLGAVEVELTPKAPRVLRANLRSYRQASRCVLYLGTEPVVRQLQGSAGRSGWRDGAAQEMGLLPSGGPDPGTAGPLSVRRLVVEDPGVARQVERHVGRHRRLT